MTEQQKKSLWESLHECYAISQVVGHSSNYFSSDESQEVSVSSYATLMERSSKLLMEAINMLDNLPDTSKADNSKNIAFVDGVK